MLQETPSLQHLVTFAAAILAPVPALESGGSVWGHSPTGQGQGDPASGAFQAIGHQPSLLKLDEDCRQGGGLAMAGADDTFAIVLPEAAQWLDTEVPKAHACEGDGISYGSVTEETRGRVVEARENDRTKVLEKALTSVRAKSTRAAWAWRQRDKISSS